MGHQKLALLLCLSTVMACTTTRPRTARPYAGGDSPSSGEVDPLLLPPAIEAHELEESKLSRIEQLKRSPVAVWIDGAGYDAIESLGFLQTLEKAGIEPALVVGTGFGCWVALSWAIDGSANRAEWQSFKWDNWHSLNSTSLLNRLRGRNGEAEFAEELKKILPSQNLRSLRVPADCVYLEEQNGLYLYKSSSEDKVETALWRQMQIEPLIGRERAQKEEAETKLHSGYNFAWPDAGALRFAAMEAGRNESSYTWIVLRGYRAGKALTGVQQKFRSDKSKETLAEMTTRGLLYTQSSSYPYTAELIKDPKKRRVYLLRGRGEAEKFLNRLLKEDLEHGAGR